MRTFITGRNGLVTLIVVMCIMTVRQPAAASADSSPAQDNTIYGCLESSSGRVRLIGDAQGACRPNETPISWNVLGPKGDTGPAGPAGPAGAPADMTQVTNLRNAVTNLQNQIINLNGLLSRVANLENFNKWSTVVDCSVPGETVAAALAKAANYRSSSITIKGTCREAVEINNPNTSLSGQGPGDGLALEPTDSRTVLAIQAEGVSINTLTVTGGWIGISTGIRAASLLRQVTISGSKWAGIWLNGGSIELDDSTITGTSTGIWAWKNAVATVNASTISANSFAGVYAERSTVMLDQGTVLSGNGTGLSLNNGSSASMNVATISQNQGFGVTIWQASTASLGNGTVITGNAGDGINLKDTGVLAGGSFGAAGSGAHVLNNGGFGVFCSGAPATAQILGVTWGGVVVSGNTGGNVNCPIGY
jgi:hypothetical protein